MLFKLTLGLFSEKVSELVGFDQLFFEKLITQLNEPIIS